MNHNGIEMERCRTDRNGRGTCTNKCWTSMVGMCRLRTCVAWLCAVMLCGMTFSCQKVAISDVDQPDGQDGKMPVEFRVSDLEQTPFAGPVQSRGTDVGASCSHLSLAVYQGGSKTVQMNQESKDADYGSFQLSLRPGAYRVIVIAHNGAKAPVMTDPAKISFDGKVTDTFYATEEFTVEGSVSRSLSLRRAVAMFRLVTSDTVPSRVTMLRFYYTGGSSTFDALNGVGCVSSRQTETRAVTSDMVGQPATFEVYTFPRSDTGSLKMQVTAHDAGANVVAQKTFDEVPVRRNLITQYKGNLFGGSSGDEKALFKIGLFSEDEWSTREHTF